MENISFRPYKETDLQELLEIYSYYILNSTATCTISPISLDQMRQIVTPESSRYKTFVILYDGEICGYCLFTRFKTREAYDISGEVTIYLKQGYLGKGIGSKAIELIEKEAKLAQIHALIALVSSENNSSKRLFEKNGYIKCAEFKEVALKFGRMFGLVCFQKII